MRDKATETPFTFYFNGTAITASTGDTIAAALLANGITTTRVTANGTPRGPFCMMGACYDCLVEIDMVTRQSCMTRALPGMTVITATPANSEDQPMLPRHSAD
jgi:predicted molibdopterin-dependent oxidoreductase YjgC